MIKGEPTTASSTTMTTPRYVSSRSANSLISFSRPTRIQASTLEYVNRILDELLLQIITSAKSLATDRIKTEGILKVLGGQSGSGSGAGALLAKNAVLEAELELRSFHEGQRKEGGKMPLGLSATSRWDGTDSFPVQSAYSILRVRCQYYSTLGDMEDPSAHQQTDHNIMSSDGRPIATITPGVVIYVTALLEFVAEYVLQNVARVIERDNSDEASPNDLVKAIEEDEGTSYVWNKMSVREEIVKQQKRLTAKVQKPWQVPDADELDMAAGMVKRQSVVPSSATESTLSSAHSAEGGGGGSSGFAAPPPLKRRTSMDKWKLGKRRGSFRSSQDLSGSALGHSGSVSVLSDLTANGTVSPVPPGGDDFDSLVSSGQTMKVSLTPNRLRSMDAGGQENGDSEDARRNARKRPGTGFAESASLRKPLPLPKEDPAPNSRPESRRSTAPPSAYRKLDSSESQQQQQQQQQQQKEEPIVTAPTITADRRKSYSVRDMVDMINGTTNSPPSPMNSTDGAFASSGRESRMSLASQTSTSETGKRFLKNLFGRKSSVSSGAPSPNPSLTSASVNMTTASQRRPSLANTFESNSTAPIAAAAAGGVGAAAAAAVAGSELVKTRSPEFVRNVSRDGTPPTTVIETSLDEPRSEHRSTTPALVGLYQEPRANASNSTLSSVNQLARGGSGSGNDVPSRKVVPWSYKGSTSGGRRSSGPLQKGGASSSQGHGGGGGVAESAPPSAWSQNNLVDPTSDAVRTPIIGSTPGRTSPSLRMQGAISSKSAETARLLVQLNQRMRECNSVDECQRLVTQALAIAAAAVHSEHESTKSPLSPLETPLTPPDPTSESVALDNTSAASAAADAAAAAKTITETMIPKDAMSTATTEQTLWNSTPTLKQVVYRNLALPMAVGYDANEDDSLPHFRRQSAVAAWLLDAEGGEEPQIVLQEQQEQLQKQQQQQPVTAVKQKISPSSSNGHDSDFLSADERTNVASSTATTIATISNRTAHPPSAAGAMLRKQRPHRQTPSPLPYETPSAAASFIDDDGGRRISTVSRNSSTVSTYKDAEEAL